MPARMINGQVKKWSNGNWIDLNSELTKSQKERKYQDELAQALLDIANTNANAAAKANEISKQAQQDQMDFNEKMAKYQTEQNWAMMNAANAFQAQQAQNANDFSSLMWNNTANYNAEAMQKQMEFNSAEAEKNRQWQENMSNTSYQRAVKDLEAAGLNPVLALMHGGASVGSGSAGTVNQASMGSISGQQAAGHMSNAGTASASGFTGILENTSNELALIGAVTNSVTTAIKAMNELKEEGILNDQNNYHNTAKIGYNIGKELRQLMIKIINGVKKAN